MKSSEILKQASASLKSDIERLRFKMGLLRKYAPRVRRAMAPMLLARKKGLVRWEPSVYIGGGESWMVGATPDQPSSCNCISVSCHVRLHDGFKNVALGRLLGEYLDAARTMNAENAACVERSYGFAFPLDEDNGKPTVLVVEIHASVADGAAHCRKVLRNVKTHVIEEKEYAIVCD